MKENLIMFFLKKIKRSRESISSRRKEKLLIVQKPFGEMKIIYGLR
jgi:hypothetical protein